MSHTSKTYAEKLHDPRWQRKRLEAMQAAGWKCATCGDGREELHVHHDRYLTDHEPWEYELRDLRCLCGTCHDLAHMPVEKVMAFAKAALLADEEGRLWLGDMLSKAQRDFEIGKRKLCREREEVLTKLRSQISEGQAISAAAGYIDRLDHPVLRKPAQEVVEDAH